MLSEILGTLLRVIQTPASQLPAPRGPGSDAHCPEWAMVISDFQCGLLVWEWGIPGIPTEISGYWGAIRVILPVPLVPGGWLAPLQCPQMTPGSGACSPEWFGMAAPPTSHKYELPSIFSRLPVITEFPPTSGPSNPKFA